MIRELRHGVALIRSDRRTETVAGVVLLAAVVGPVVVEVARTYREKQS